VLDLLSLPPTARIFVGVSAVDMRRSFDGLSAVVREVLRENPLSGHLFVFRNRRGDRLKILWWDRSGYSLFYKRLERGTFQLPLDSPRRDTHIETESAELSLMLEGIDLNGARRRPRWDPRSARAAYHAPA
jgi:transposase